MVAAWPEPVERVASFLREAGAEARLEELAGPDQTPAGAAESIGCKRGQLVTSFVFSCDGASVVALVPSDRRADAAKVARAVGAALARPARADEVEAATGARPGAVAPFPPRPSTRILVERTLLAQPLVWVGGGSARHLVALAPAELVRLSRAEPMDVVEEPAYHSSPETDGKEP